MGCSNDGRGGATGSNDEASRSKVRPTYVRYDGVKPELAGAEYKISDGFLSYPADPVQPITEPPGHGKPITAMTCTNAPIPPELSQNAYCRN